MFDAICSSGDTFQSFNATDLTDVAGMSLPVEAGKNYWFKFVVRWHRSGTGDGPRFAVTIPPHSVTMAATVDISHTDDGSDGVYHGRLIIGGDSVKPGRSPGDFSIATIEGLASIGSIPGEIKLQCADGSGMQWTTVYAHSVGFLKEVP